MRDKRHTGKSRAERESYFRAISETGSDATSGSDTGVEYDTSDTPKIEAEVKPRRKTRRKSLPQKITDNIKDNWLAYLIPAFFAVAIVFIIFMNRDIGKLEGKVENIQSDMTTIKGDLKEINKRLSTHDTDISQSNSRLDRVEERSHKK